MVEDHDRRPLLREGHLLRPVDRLLLLLLQLLLTVERTVLFVCVENAGRSLIAEAAFNAHRPPGFVAESAGTEPSAEPHPRTAAMLREIGLEIPGHPPQRLTPQMLEGAAVCVTMGCLDRASCPARLRSRDPEDWGLPDPARLDDEGFRQVRDEIVARVLKLSARLANAGSRGPPSAGHS